jgi:hypothetical protein
MAEIKLAQTYKFLVEKRQRERERERERENEELKYITLHAIKACGKSTVPSFLSSALKEITGQLHVPATLPSEEKRSGYYNCDGVKRNQPLHNRIPSEKIL